MRKVLCRLAAIALLAPACLLFGCGGGAVDDGAYISNDSVTPAQEAAEPEPAPAEEPAPEPEPEPEPAATGYTVAIDAGHQASGNFDHEPIGPGASQTKIKVSSGTAGRTSGVAESRVNLDVALKLRDYLAAKGVNVVMVRETEEVDIPNSERAAIANDAGSDLFIRIHCDGSEDTSRNGLCTLVPGINEWTGPIYEQSSLAGNLVQQHAVAATGAADLGVVERTDLSGFNWCTVPVVLVEMGFMTNPDEDLRLVDPAYQDLLAQGIGDGALAYLATLD